MSVVSTFCNSTLFSYASVFSLLACLAAWFKTGIPSLLPGFLWQCQGCKQIMLSIFPLPLQSHFSLLLTLSPGCGTGWLASQPLLCLWLSVGLGQWEASENFKRLILEELQREPCMAERALKATLKCSILWKPHSVSQQTFWTCHGYAP